ncbi:SIS domain-containing protein [Staphylococcus schleiferi subsp. coagulans]|uniref:SIS domain-containing protein n=1 Tax=Staphylococcus coagulans TaxID=74706 RepID=UPI0015F7D9AA|nr:SIS domain-containing protein [Staphylococcus coagulans]MBA8768748.1 SIS domain-containing protein [Staphylococcus coagulans]
MLLDEHINAHFPKLNDNDFHIIKAIEAHIDHMKNMKIQDLALLSHTSVSSIHRLCRKIGFDGYSELKAYIKLNHQSVSISQDTVSLLEHDIQQTIKHLNHIDFSSLNQRIDDAPFIYIYGTGTAQQTVAQDVQRQILTLHKKSIVLNNELELLHAIDMMSSDDLLIIISLSEETQRLDNVIKSLKVKQVSYISVTTLQNNALAQHATFNIYVYSTPFSLYNHINNSSFVTFHIAFDIIIRKYSSWKTEHSSSQ